MTFKSKYGIGEVVYLFGFNKWPCVVTAVEFKANGSVMYLLDWHADGEPKSEWYDEARLELLPKAGADAPSERIGQ